MFKKESGITLVALVITIIVLLILAGVAISTLSGRDNIINKAQEAKQSYINDKTDTDAFLDNTMQYLNEYAPARTPASGN